MTLAGVCLTTWSSNRKNANDAAMRQAITDTKLEELTREVHRYDNFVKRMPVMEEKIKVMNHRIEDLERGAKA